ncbi:MULTISPECIES: hypothetical protein [Nonomuraea]|uniref:Uncharacterized protein n=1 Tax=Nonomuraea salmonea TaxID=46181 RepID=A0ABV5NLH4_9ACTN
MPKLKSVIAGLAISTAVTGGMVGVGAATSAANATTQVSNGTSVLMDDGWGWGWGHRRHHNRHHNNRCGRHHGGWGGGWGGWGWGHRRHHRGEVCVVIRNHNTNDNGPRQRHHHHHDDQNRTW